MTEETLLPRFDMQESPSLNTGVQVRPPQQREYSGIDSDEMCGCVDDDNDGDCKKISSCTVANSASSQHCLRIYLDTFQ